MTQLMESAIAKAKQLPEADQNAIASIILGEIESESRWIALFADPRSDDLLSSLADEALREAKDGRATPLDMSDL